MNGSQSPCLLLLPSASSFSSSLILHPLFPSCFSAQEGRYVGLRDLHLDLNFVALR